MIKSGGLQYSAKKLVMQLPEKGLIFALSTYDMILSIPNSLFFNQ